MSASQSPIQQALDMVSRTAPTDERLRNCAHIDQYSQALEEFEGALGLVIQIIQAKSDFGTKEAVKAWLQDKNKLCLPLLTAMELEATPLKRVMDQMIKYPVVLKEETGEIIAHLAAQTEAYNEIHELALKYADSINDMPSNDGKSKVVCIPHNRVRAELCADVLEKHIDKIMSKESSTASFGMLPHDITPAKRAGELFIEKIINPLVAEHAGSDVRTPAEQEDAKNGAESPGKRLQINNNSPYMRYVIDDSVAHLNKFHINSFADEDFADCHRDFMDLVSKHDVFGHQLEHVELNTTRTMLGLLQFYPRMFIRPLYLYSRYEEFETFFRLMSQLANSSGPPLAQISAKKTSVL